MAARDPHTHAERDLILTRAVLEQAVTDVTGLTVPAPATLSTLCERRRPASRVSTDPDVVTCPNCRRRAVAQLREWAEVHNLAVLLIPCDDPRVVAFSAEEDRLLRLAGQWA
jgi:hypothetical protein